MKPQDIIFFAVLAIFSWRRDMRLLVILGLLLLFLAIPLFASWTFFTAERFTWYSGAFFLSAALLQLFKAKKV